MKNKRLWERGTGAAIQSEADGERERETERERERERKRERVSKRESFILHGQNCIEKGAGQC